MALLRPFSGWTNGSGGRGHMVRRFWRRARRVTAVLCAPLLAGSQVLVPVAAGAGVAAAAAGLVVAHPAPARASSGSVLILSTSVNGGSSSPEAQDVPSGYTVTVASASTWDAMTTAQFASYSAIVIGDPSSGGTCASSVPADALSTAATWGPAVTGDVAVLGTAPALAGGQGTSLMQDAIRYAAAGSGTGLYVSLNCEYSAASARTAVPLLASVEGGGFLVRGQGSSCPDSGHGEHLGGGEQPAVQRAGQRGAGVVGVAGVLGAGDV